MPIPLPRSTMTQPYCNRMSSRGQDVVGPDQDVGNRIAVLGQALHGRRRHCHRLECSNRWTPSFLVVEFMPEHAHEEREVDDDQNKNEETISNRGLSGDCGIESARN